MEASEQELSEEQKKMIKEPPSIQKIKEAQNLMKEEDTIRSSEPEEATPFPRIDARFYCQPPAP